MPKIFSDEEKDFHRKYLLNNGLKLIMDKGYKNVTVEHLIEMIGASKGYFYVLFPSKEEFFLNALAWQMEKNYAQLEKAVNRGCNPDQIKQFYRDIFKNGMHFANFEDVMYVQQKVSEEQWEKFRDFQFKFFTRVLRLLGRDVSQCDPKTLSNLSAVMFLSYASRSQYLFLDKMDDTIDVLLEAFHSYIFGSDCSA